MFTRVFRSFVAVPLAALMTLGPSAAMAGGSGGGGFGGFSFGGGSGGWGGFGGGGSGHGSGHGGGNWGGFGGNDWGNWGNGNWGSGNSGGSHRSSRPRSNTVRRHSTPRSNSVPKTAKSKKPRSNSLPKTAKSTKPRSNSLPQTALKSSKQAKPLANVVPVKKINPHKNEAPQILNASLTPEQLYAWTGQTQKQIEKHAKALVKGKPSDEQIEELLSGLGLTGGALDEIKELVRDGKGTELEKLLDAAKVPDRSAHALMALGAASAWIDTVASHAYRGTLTTDQLAKAAKALRAAGLFDSLSGSLINLALNLQLERILGTARPGSNPVPRGQAVNVALRGLPAGKVIPLGNGAVLTGARTGAMPGAGANGAAGASLVGPGRGINPAAEGGGTGRPMSAVTGGGAQPADPAAEGNGRGRVMSNVTGGGVAPGGQRQIGDMAGGGAVPAGPRTFGRMDGGGAVPGGPQVAAAAVGVQITNVNINAPGGPVFNGPGGPPFGPGPFWGGGPFFPGPFFGGGGFGPPLDMFIDVGDPWETAGVDMPLGPPAPDAEGVAAGAGVVLRNVGDSTVNYLVNESDFSMQPRYTQDLPGGRSWVVSFDRGGSLGTARYTLTEGTYDFTPTEDGWELFKKTFQAVIDNGGNDQAFLYVWKDQEQSMEAGEAKEHTDIYPLIVKFDDGKGGTKERSLESGDYKVSTTPDDNTLELYPASSFESPEPTTVAYRAGGREAASASGPSRPRLLASTDDEPRREIPNLFGEVTTSAEIFDLFASDDPEESRTVQR